MVVCLEWEGVGGGVPGKRVPARLGGGLARIARH